MANSNAPTGLVPVRYASGAPYNGACNIYYVPASDGTALFLGDPVIIAGDSDTNGISTVTRATAGATNRVTGVVVGFRPSTTIVANGYRAASTAEYVYVSDDPNLLYEVQEDAIGGALPTTAVGLNADLIAGAGSTATRLSGWQLDSSTAATGATLQTRIIGFVVRRDNTPGQANAKVLVRINLPTETGAAGSTGV